MRNIFSKNLLLLIVGLVTPLLIPITSFAQDDMDQYYETPEMVKFKPDFISIDQVKKMMDEGDKSFVLVDNQPAMAYNEDHIPGAINFPFVTQITPPVNLPRNKTLILYCPCGPDDADAVSMAKKLRMFGYFRVKIMHGGWFGWQDKGYPTTKKAEEDEKGNNADGGKANG